MHAERLPAPDQKMTAALDELRAMVLARYPTTTFEVAPGEDDPQAVHLWATVDLDDPDEVVDLVIDRVLALQIEEGLPVHVIPVRTPARAAALRRAQAAAAPSWRRPHAPLTP